MTTTPSEIFKVLQTTHDEAQIHSLSKSLHRAIFASPGNVNSQLLAYCWPLILQLRDSLKKSVLCWLAKFTADTCKQDGNLEYVADSAPIILQHLSHTDRHVVCAAGVAACHAIPGVLEYMLTNPENAIERRLWECFTAIKSTMVTSTTSSHTSVCLEACQFLKTVIVNFSAPKSSTGYQNAKAASNPNAVAVFDVTRIPENHSVLNAEFLGKDAGTILVLLLRKLNSTSSEKPASVITGLLNLLYGIVCSRPQYTGLIVDAIVYFHTYDPYVLPKTQRRSVKHILRTVMNNIKVKSPGKWNDVLDQCLSGSIERGRGSNRQIGVGAQDALLSLYAVRQSEVGIRGIPMTPLINPESQNAHYEHQLRTNQPPPQPAPFNAATLVITPPLPSSEHAPLNAPDHALPTPSSPEQATNSEITIQSADAREELSLREISKLEASSTFSRVIQSVSRRLQNSLVVPVDIFPIFVTLARFASVLAFTDRVVVNFLNLIQSLVSQPFTAQAGKILLMLWLYSEYKNVSVEKKSDASTEKKNGSIEKKCDVSTEPTPNSDGVLSSPSERHSGDIEAETEERSPPSDRYHSLLNEAIMILRLSADSSLFRSVALEVPLISDTLFVEIFHYCNTKAFEDIGLETLRDLVLQRPPCRRRALEMLLQQAGSADKVVRGKALNNLESVIHVDSVAHAVVECSLRHLEQILEKQHAKAESPADRPATSVPAASFKTHLKKEEAKTIVQILMSLPLRMGPHHPMLLRRIAELYAQSNPEFRLAVSSLTLKFFQTVGADSEAVLSLLSDIPDGSDNFIVALIEVNGPTPRLVRKVIDAFANKSMNQATFLISILPGLTSSEAIRFLPKIVALPSSKLRLALGRLLSASEPTPLTPEEVLFHLHTIDVQRESLKLRDIVQAVEICFEEAPNVVVQTEVLSVVLHQLITISPLPTVLMRTLLLILSHCPSMITEVLNVMSILISKQIWTDSMLWPGFLLCCIKTMPNSVSVLMQLPPPQLQRALDNERLRERVLLDLRSGRMLPKTIHDALTAHASSHPPPDASDARSL